jgi:hypothetical protein
LQAGEVEIVVLVRALHAEIGILAALTPCRAGHALPRSCIGGERGRRAHSDTATSAAGSSVVISSGTRQTVL